MVGEKKQRHACVAGGESAAAVAEGDGKRRSGEGC